MGRTLRPPAPRAAASKPPVRGRGRKNGSQPGGTCAVSPCSSSSCPVSTRRSFSMPSAGGGPDRTGPGRAAPHRTGRDGPTGSDAPGGAAPRLRTGAARPPAAGERGSLVGPGPGNRLIAIRTAAICASSAAVNPQFNKAFRGGTGWQRRDGPRPCRSRRSGAMAPQREGAWGSGQARRPRERPALPPEHECVGAAGPAPAFPGPSGRSAGCRTAGALPRRSLS